MMALRIMRSFAVPLAALLAGWLALTGILAWRANGEMREELLQQVRMAAQSVAVESVQALVGDETDLDKPEYGRLKDQFEALIRVNSRYRYIYLMGRRDDGAVFFFIDTGQPEDRAKEARPGQTYDDIQTGLREALIYASEAVEGPYADAWGAFITGAVPLRDPRTGKVVAMLGVDVDVGGWRREVWAAVALPSFLLFAMLAAMAAAVVALRQHRRDLRQMRDMFESRDMSRPIAGSALRRTRQNALVLALVLLVVCVAGNMALKRYVIMPDFERLEAMEAERVVSGCLDAIGREAEQLGLLVLDWAFWDDTYEFLDGKNPDYPSANLEWPALSKSQIDMVHMCTSDGETVVQGIFDPVREAMVELTAFPRAGRLKPVRLLEHPDPEAPQTGLLLTESGPMLVASAGVLTTKMEGPSPGTIVLGRFLRGELPKNLAKQMGVAPPAIDSAESPDLGGREKRALSKLVPGGTMLDIIDENRMIGHGLLADVDGRPALLVSVELPRSIVQRGRASARLVSGILFLAVLGVGVGIFAWSAAASGELRRRHAHVEALVARRTAALAESEGRLAATLRSIGDGVIACDREGRVERLNQVAEALTGWTSAEAEGKRIEEIFRIVDARSRVPRENPAERALREGAVVALANHTVLIGRNGVECHIADSCAPIRDAEGCVWGAVLVFRDVTERLRIEEMMMQNEKMLSVGGLAAGMAHEINNPLGGMIQTASVMAERLLNLDLPANRRAAEEAGTTMESISAFMEERGIVRMLENIRKSGSRAAEIVTNMLSFARKDDMAKYGMHDLAVLLDRCVDMAGSDYDLKKKTDFRQIEVVREYEAGLPPVPCESGKIQQVLLNVLRNGAEAMQEGGKAGQKHRFTLRLAHEKAARRIRIEIEDNGPGMDEATRRRVFEPFFTTKPPDRGTGLGLSVSYFIVTENHGGEMRVESEPGKGATFTIWLPLERMGA